MTCGRRPEPAELISSKAPWRERIERFILKAMIALPKMRKHPYPMLLGRTPEETAMLPREPGKVTVIESRDGRITAVPGCASLHPPLVP